MYLKKSLYFFRNLFIFFYFIPLMCIKLFRIVLMIFHISVVSFVPSPLSFLILFECSLFALLTLHACCFIFSRNTFLVLLIFSIVFLVSILNLCSNLCYFFSFSWCWASFVLLFLVRWGVKLGSLKLLLFLVIGIYHYEHPSSNCFFCISQVLVCYIFIVICFSYLKNFFSLTDYFYSSMLFNFHVCEFSSFFCVINL